MPATAGFTGIMVRPNRGGTMMRRSILWLSALVAAPVMAQDMADQGPTITVMGEGRVSTPPDTARIDYWVLGEGKTADDASRALAAKNDAIVAGLSALLGRDTSITASEVGLIEARDPKCESRPVENRPALSADQCATVGYVARLQGSIATGRIDKAATAIGLAGRLGARDARLQAFQLANDAPARQAAVADAVRAAKVQAGALAAAAGVTLGPVVTIRDQTQMNYGSIVVSGSRVLPLIAPAAMAAPVAINLTPRAIETRANVQVIFRIGR